MIYCLEFAASIDVIEAIQINSEKIQLHFDPLNQANQGQLIDQ